MWNGGLESMAQQWANQCNFKHGQPTRTSKPFDPIGQNLFASTAGYFFCQSFDSIYSGNSADMFNYVFGLQCKKAG